MDTASSVSRHLSKRLMGSQFEAGVHNLPLPAPHVHPLSLLGVHVSAHCLHQGVHVVAAEAGAGLGLDLLVSISLHVVHQWLQSLLVPVQVCQNIVSPSSTKHKCALGVLSRGCKVQAREVDLTLVRGLLQLVDLIQVSGLLPQLSAINR